MEWRKILFHYLEFTWVGRFFKINGILIELSWKIQVKFHKSFTFPGDGIKFFFTSIKGPLFNHRFYIWGCFSFLHSADCWTISNTLDIL